MSGASLLRSNAIAPGSCVDIPIDRVDGSAYLPDLAAR